MVAPIRPGFVPANPQAATPARADAARTQAQRAFFQAATGQAVTVQQPAASAVAPHAEPVRTQRIPDPTAEPPQRILRPGSLLDIKV